MPFSEANKTSYQTPSVFFIFTWKRLLRMHLIGTSPRSTTSAIKGKYVSLLSNAIKITSFIKSSLVETKSIAKQILKNGRYFRTCKDRHAKLYRIMKFVITIILVDGLF